MRRTWEKHGQGTHLIVESLTLLGPAYADLDAPRHHAVVGLGVCQLIHVDDQLILRTIRNAAVNVCSRHHHCGQKIADTGSLQLDDRLSPAPFPGSVRLTYGRPSSPETRPHSFFPRRKMRLPRGRFAPKYLCLTGPPLRCGPYRFRLWAAAISGHASPGNGSQANTQ